MIEKIDDTIWKDKESHIVKLSADFKWHFYGRRFTNFKISCIPERKGLAHRKETAMMCNGYWVHAYLDSIDDALYEAWKYCETADEARKWKKYAKTFLSKLPRHGISRGYFDFYFREFKIEIN